MSEPEESAPSEPSVVLAVDGNSLLHRAYHANARTGFRTLDGQPGWAVRGLLAQLVAAVDRVSADAVVVGFDDRTHSRRKQRWPVYKAQRDPKPETLERQLDLAVEVLAELGVTVVVPDGLEADDVLASVAAQAPGWGSCTVVATSDRDSFALVGEHTRMLRILNGGVEASPLLDPARLTMVTGVRPEQYADLAALRGDASDNLPGVPGYGAKTAVRLLAALDTAEAAFDDAAGEGHRCRAAVGAARTRALAADGARERWAFNRQVMTMVADVALEAPAALPLDEQTVHATFGRFGLHVPSAVRALTLREPTRSVAEASQRWVDPRWFATAPRPQHPPRPLQQGPRPQLVTSGATAYVQETLF